MSNAPTIATTGWRLEYTEGTSSKFYEVFVTDDGIVMSAWGRIGSTGQNKAQKFPDRKSAEIAGMRQVFTKEAAGYRRVHDAVAFEMDAGLLEAAIRGNQSGHFFRNAMNKALQNPGHSLHQFLAEAGLDESGAETLIRLAVCIIVDGLDEALRSFGEPDEVDALARRVERKLYHPDETEH